ncbi:hypothetical protein C4H11_02620 [Bacteroides zoogleoformans]|uniref:Uncharacterized protein n=1 Tax=Bacteroides zoogleoformans TaxID=28119 RepID=A0ABM6T5K2_9BACE|nr:hypothetical protein C4H11_02620 [Bacteroides zoogleoformans]
MPECNFDIAIFYPPSDREKSRKNTYFCGKFHYIWCRSGKKEKRTPPVGESDDNRCGCRRKSHRKSR